MRDLTCVWGEPGSNAHHSFYQLLHHGTEQVSIDFLLPAKSGVGAQRQQDLAAANCLAQTWVLADGDPETEPRGRTSTILKVFVQGVMWDVNSSGAWNSEKSWRRS
jgi:glucose-6-phosphate isomerase